MLKTFLILILPLMLAAACGPIHFKSGKPFTATQIESVKKGETKKADIISLFGEPQLSGKNDSGEDIWSYLYIEAKVPLKGGPSKEKFQRMTITFEGDKVKSITYEMSKEAP